ncbi:MAG: beta-aspartyl-peptidase [Halanaerobiales bacterium]|nr:beta-aspartyl-peptidase [Halanaerobiales bacterium]
MLTIIKNGQLYSPEHLGNKDILIAGEKIIRVAGEIEIPSVDFYPVQLITATDKIIVPGLIDSHVHIIGGGGEGGFKTRTPEIQLTELSSAGITTVVGCLGADGTTRHLSSLLAKARALEEEGITSYIYTGSYQLPLQTITGNCRDDLILIDKVIGVGELALADHRSSQPTLTEFKQVAALARTGGLLANKAGLLNVHLGDGEKGLDYLLRIAQETEIPLDQFLPTHLNRNKELLESVVDYVKKGGLLDLTTSSTESPADRSIPASRAARLLLEKGVAAEAITFSSDGMGSLPLFDHRGNFCGLGIGAVSSLWLEVLKAIQQEGIPLAEALKFVTANVADRLKLTAKGRIAENYSADLVLLNKDLTIDTVIARGRVLIENKRVLVKGTFEK